MRGNRNVRAVGLGRDRAHGAQSRVGAERGEGFHFGAARAAYSPRLLEHARQRPATAVAPLRHVVVAAGCEQSRKTAKSGRVVGACLLDGLPHRRRMGELEQRVEIATGHEQIRASVRLLAGVVLDKALRTAIAGDDFVDAYLADASSGHVAQILLERNAESCELAGIDVGERLREPVTIRCDRLARPADAERALDSHRPKREQAFPGADRVVEAERREAGEHRVTCVDRKLVRPTFRNAFRVVDERMADGFRGDERMRRNASEQMVLAADSESVRVVRADQRIGRDEIAIAGDRRRFIVVAGEAIAFERGEPAGDLGTRRVIVRGPITRRAAMHIDDASGWHREFGRCRGFSASAQSPVASRTR